MSVTFTLSASEMAKVKMALDQWGKVVSNRLRQASAITAEDVKRDAIGGFGGNYDEDISRTVLGATSKPVPPYKAQSDLMPHTRSGLLKNSIRVEKQSADVYMVKAGNEVAPYAAYVEFGTRTARPHPFMFPATEMNRKRWRERIDKAIQDPTGVKK